MGHKSKLVAIVCLATLCLGSWFYVLRYFNNHKVDIVIHLSDITKAIALPYHLAILATKEPDRELVIPIMGLDRSDIADTWREARSDGREHEGVDIFARRGTPIFSATAGYILRVGVNNLGGNIVFVSGAGGVRYYYAHLDRVAAGITVGQKVTVDTVLGFVGNTGNAITTPPHLHFGKYFRREAQNPYDQLVSR